MALLLLIPLALVGITIACGLLSKVFKDFPRPDSREAATFPTPRRASSKRFRYPSTRLMQLSLFLGVVWFFGGKLDAHPDLLAISGTGAVIGFILGCALKFFENIYDAVGGVFEFGPGYRATLKAHEKIAESEKKNGYMPVGWQIGKLGGDAYGLFWERKDGTRNRMV